MLNKFIEQTKGPPVRTWGLERGYIGCDPWRLTHTRAELTSIERAEHIAEWIRLTEEKQRQQEVSSQVEKKPQGGRPKGGRISAAREIGVSLTLTLSA